MSSYYGLEAVEDAEALTESEAVEGSAAVETPAKPKATPVTKKTPASKIGSKKAVLPVTPVNNKDAHFVGEIFKYSEVSAQCSPEVLKAIGNLDNKLPGWWTRNSEANLQGTRVCAHTHIIGRKVRCDSPAPACAVLTCTGPRIAERLEARHRLCVRQVHLGRPPVHPRGHCRRQHGAGREAVP